MTLDVVNNYLFKLIIYSLKTLLIPHQPHNHEVIGKKQCELLLNI